MVQKAIMMAEIQAKQSKVFLHGRCLSEGTGYDHKTDFGYYPDYAFETDEDWHLYKAKQNQKQNQKQNRKQNTKYDRSIEGKILESIQKSNSKEALQRGSTRWSTAGHNDETDKSSRFDSLIWNYKRLFEVSFFNPADQRIYT